MFQHFFNTYSISPENTLIIACSGGPDSMYLLSEMMKFHGKNHLVVAHFNHAIRGAESDADADFLRGFCASNGLIFVTEKKDIPGMALVSKKWIEETARIERYTFLESIREKYSAKHILTAHHLDDSIETLMFNLIRWAKIHGLTGIPEQNGSTLRPLLHLQKSEILRQLAENGTPYRLDSTNTDDTYLRNHLRLNIIAEFERINPEYRKNLASFMNYSKELTEFIDSQVTIFLRGESSFGVEDFHILSPFLQREVIRYLYEGANHGTIGLSEGAIAEAIRFTGDKGNYTKKELSKLLLTKKNGRVYF